MPELTCAPQLSKLSLNNALRLLCFARTNSSPTGSAIVPRDPVIFVGVADKLNQMLELGSVCGKPGYGETNRLGPGHFVFKMTRDSNYTKTRANLRIREINIAVPFPLREYSVA